MQSPRSEAASRGDENDGARRRAENGCGHAAWSARPDVRPGLRAHHDRAAPRSAASCTIMAAAAPALAPPPARARLRMKASCDRKRGGCQGVVSDMENGESGVIQLASPRATGTAAVAWRSRREGPALSSRMSSADLLHPTAPSRATASQDIAPTGTSEACGPSGPRTSARHRSRRRPRSAWDRLQGADAASVPAIAPETPFRSSRGADADRRQCRPSWAQTG